MAGEGYGKSLKSWWLGESSSLFGVAKLYIVQLLSWYVLGYFVIALNLLCGET